ncbi:MAG: IS1634 family transposase [Anaerolineae bacterium]|nr:IS1634 family transposase [Anaerolineae bacterium]
MYIRTTRRKNKDGSVVEYLQLAENQWDPDAGRSQARILYSFGRADQIDADQIRRLVKSLARFLSPAEAVQATAAVDGTPALDFLESRPWGGAWALDQLWQHLGIQEALESMIQDRAYRVPIERALFAMVANRALAPQSKLSVSEWVAQDVALPGVDTLPVQQLYRAMDFLLEAQDQVQWKIYDQIAHLLNLEVDLLYFDTTSTYFETDETDGDEGFRQFGHSKDHRKDRPQIVIGLAVTRDGLPIRCWSWSGNTSDQAVVEQVKADLVGWKLGRVVTVVDRGMVSEANLRTLQRAGGQYIAGVKLRSGQPEVETALSKRGRFTPVQEHLRIKEILVGEGEARQRFVLAYNPREAERQAATRDAMLDALEEQLQQLRTLDGTAHTKAHCDLRSHPTYGRYVRMLKTGALKIDRTKVRNEAFLDGKYLLTTSDDTLEAADVALGYKQLLQVEDAFRTLKSRLALRPMFHRKPERIQAHVVLCWLALLLVRVAENRTDESWATIRRTLERLHLVTFKGAHGKVQQRTELTPNQHHLFRQVEVEPPPRIAEMSPQ